MRKYCLFILFLFLVACEKLEVRGDFIYSGSYAVIGDSITYGKGSSDNTSWSDILKTSLQVSDYENYAVCGAVASSRNPDSQYALKTQIELMDSRFDLITVMIGINDCLLGKEIYNVDEVIGFSPENIDFRRSFTHGFVYDLYLLLNRFPDSKIIVIGPPSISYPTKSNLQDYVRVEKEVSALMGLPFIDLSESQYSPNGNHICSDKIHPTDLGYSIIADYILNIIKNELL